MTPMVDVVMVILIFFMASTTLLGPELLLRTSIAREPEAAGASSEATGDPRFSIESPTFVLSLSVREGRALADGIGLRGGSVDDIGSAAALLASRLGEDGAAETTFVVTASDDVPYEAVLRAVELMRDAGLERVAVR